MPQPPFASSGLVFRGPRWHPVRRGDYYADATHLRVEVRAWRWCVPRTTVAEGRAVVIRERYGTVRDDVGQMRSGRIVAYRK